MADAHTKPQHDYHLVDPSPWPAIGAISAFLLAVGLITWMHKLFAAAPLVFAAGALGVAYTMIAWWRWSASACMVGNGPRCSAPAWGVPDEMSTVLMYAGDAVVPRTALYACCRSAAAPATIGLAPELPLKLSVYDELKPGHRSPYPVVTMESPQPWRSTVDP